MSFRFSSHHELQAFYATRFDDDVAAGKYSPLTFQLLYFPALLAFLYFFIPHRQHPWVYKSRHVVYAVIVGYMIHLNRHYAFKKMAHAFALGLVSSWMIMWYGVMILIYDPQKDFKRVEWGSERHPQVGKEANGINTSVEQSLQKDRKSDVKQSNKPPSANGAACLEVSDASRPSDGDIGRYHYIWQPYPIESLMARAIWVTDLLHNFRLLGWNHHIPGTPPPPKVVQEELQYSTTSQQTLLQDGITGLNGTRGYAMRREVIKRNLRRLLIGYIKLDVLKVIMMKDPYFWGYVDSAPPSYFPTVVANSSVLVRSYRLLFTMWGIQTSIETIFTLSPLCFCGILGPKWLGAHAEPWIYPDFYGSFSNVYDRGLPGFWGGFWHQTFRFAFDAPAKPIAKALGLNPKSSLGLFVRSLIAFSLSGFMHGSGSFAGHGETYPLTSSFVFFLKQPFGILFEHVVVSALRRSKIAERTPKIVGQIFRFTWVFFWLYWTAPLIAAEFARGGLWLFEPVGVSPLRALGFGVEGDSWWTWGEPSTWFHYHNSGKWWSSGIYQ